ncbi:(2Fe-2S)-binding protein [Aeromicrobium camelliae]|uniref:(2Fe-2S)-binding protein n=1 Tax=Aeromicrobium camelliae TaxID=1538144 RepID=A0A3N6WSA5_9ACTN|nr:(2Fe-2S)-binding protein [Aeromicrobium camelliae]RQN07872.1 (2Fe-2S)-binding protein [Aeromicrobium camelliae]
MSARAVDPRRDPIQPGPTDPVTITFEGREYVGVRGQSVAGVLLANNVLDWRTTSTRHEPRGLFCGIGVCFDCVVTVDGQRDVRACQRTARDGAQVERQHDELPRRVEEAGS